MMTSSRKKILLIDDDNLVLKTLERLLLKVDYDVSIARNPEEALQAAAANRFDLVISDIRMPGKSGIQVIESIQQKYEEVGHLAAYMLITGFTEEDTPAHAIRLGINKFLFKPFDNHILLDSISEELDIIKDARTLRDLPPVIEKSPHRKKQHAHARSGRRVAVTGFGTVSPAGLGKDLFWKGLGEGKNYVDCIRSFDCSSFPSKAGSEVPDFEPEQFGIPRSELRRMDRASCLARVAAQMALEDSGLELSITSAQAASVVIGSAVGGYRYLEEDLRNFEREGLKKVRPFLGIAGYGGAISSEVSRALGIRGQSVTVSTGSGSATDAMGQALDLIRSGRSDIVVSGGTDAGVTPGILAAFCKMGAVTFREKDFHRACRPFNADRDGFALSEGAWIFVFEEMEQAVKRKARIYAELAGYGATCDAWHMAKPHPSGEHTVRAIQLALEDAGILPDDVDLFEAYANSTPVNDGYETAVVKKVFGDHAASLLMPSIKSMFGHPLGASGAQQVGGALLALTQGIVHPTINYETPDPECNLDYVSNEARQKKVSAAVCNTIALGAKNSTLVLKSV